MLSLDVGDRRIGVALSDPTGLIATPLMTIWRTAEGRDQEKIASLVEEHQVERVVIGLPRTLRGELGPQAQRVLRFGQRLSEAFATPVVYWDERYTTADAESIVRRRGRGGKRPSRGELDPVAAAIILQNYLDRLNYSPGDEDDPIPPRTETER